MLMATTLQQTGGPSPLREPARTPLQIHRPGDAGRAGVEEFIRSVYARRFGAHVTAFAPVLVSLHDPVDGSIVAAAGYRQASGSTLFLERYLDAPVEQVLARQGGDVPARAGIFEVGHLAAQRAGEGRRLIFLLGDHLAGVGAQWVVSTLTEELRHLFVRLGITPLALGRADPGVLGGTASQWGTYYDHHPVVLAGQVQQALRLLARGRRQRQERS
jgi:hypothetical protein